LADIQNRIPSKLYFWRNLYPHCILAGLLGLPDHDGHAVVVALERCSKILSACSFVTGERYYIVNFHDFGSSGFQYNTPNNNTIATSGSADRPIAFSFEPTKANSSRWITNSAVPNQTIPTPTVLSSGISKLIKKTNQKVVSSVYIIRIAIGI
jgi:hypothetical protein